MYQVAEEAVDVTDVGSIPSQEFVSTRACVVDRVDRVDKQQSQVHIVGGELNRVIPAVEVDMYVHPEVQIDPHVPVPRGIMKFDQRDINSLDIIEREEYQKLTILQDAKDRPVFPQFHQEKYEVQSEVILGFPLKKGVAQKMQQNSQAIEAKFTQMEVLEKLPEYIEGKEGSLEIEGFEDPLQASRNIPGMQYKVSNLSDLHITQDNNSNTVDIDMILTNEEMPNGGTPDPINVDAIHDDDDIQTRSSTSKSVHGIVEEEEDDADNKKNIIANNNNKNIIANDEEQSLVSVLPTNNVATNILTNEELHILNLFVHEKNGTTPSTASISDPVEEVIPLKNPYMEEIGTDVQINSQVIELSRLLWNNVLPEVHRNRDFGDFTETQERAATQNHWQSPWDQRTEAEMLRKRAATQQQWSEIALEMHTRASQLRNTEIAALEGMESERMREKLLLEKQKTDHLTSRIATARQNGPVRDNSRTLTRTNPWLQSRDLQEDEADIYEGEYTGEDIHRVGTEDQSLVLARSNLTLALQTYESGREVCGCKLKEERYVCYCDILKKYNAKLKDSVNSIDSHQLHKQVVAFDNHNVDNAAKLLLSRKSGKTRIPNPYQRYEAGSMYSRTRSRHHYKMQQALQNCKAVQHMKDVNSMLKRVNKDEKYHFDDSILSSTEIEEDKSVDTPTCRDSSNDSHANTSVSDDFSWNELMLHMDDVCDVEVDPQKEEAVVQDCIEELVHDLNMDCNIQKDDDTNISNNNNSTSIANKVHIECASNTIAVTRIDQEDCPIDHVSSDKNIINDHTDNNIMNDHNDHGSTDNNIRSNGHFGRYTSHTEMPIYTPVQTLEQSLSEDASTISLQTLYNAFLTNQTVSQSTITSIIIQYHNNVNQRIQPSQHQLSILTLLTRYNQVPTMQEYLLQCMAEHVEPCSILALVFTAKEAGFVLAIPVLDLSYNTVLTVFEWVLPANMQNISKLVQLALTEREYTQVHSLIKTYLQLYMLPIDEYNTILTTKEHAIVSIPAYWLPQCVYTHCMVQTYTKTHLTLPSVYSPVYISSDIVYTCFHEQVSPPLYCIYDENRWKYTKSIITSTNHTKEGYAPPMQPSFTKQGDTLAVAAGVMSLHTYEFISTVSKKSIFTIYQDQLAEYPTAEDITILLHYLSIYTDRPTQNHCFLCVAPSVYSDIITIQLQNQAVYNGLTVFSPITKQALDSLESREQRDLIETPLKRTYSSRSSSSILAILCHTVDCQTRANAYISETLEDIISNICPNTLEIIQTKLGLKIVPQNMISVFADVVQPLAQCISLIQAGKQDMTVQCSYQSPLSTLPSSIFHSLVRTEGSFITPIFSRMSNIYHKIKEIHAKYQLSVYKEYTGKVPKQKPIYSLGSTPETCVSAEIAILTLGATTNTVSVQPLLPGAVTSVSTGHEAELDKLTKTMLQESQVANKESVLETDNLNWRNSWLDAIYTLLPNVLTSFIASRPIHAYILLAQMQHTKQAHWSLLSISASFYPPASTKRHEADVLPVSFVGKQLRHMKPKIKETILSSLFPQMGNSPFKVTSYEYRGDKLGYIETYFSAAVQAMTASFKQGVDLVLLKHLWDGVGEPYNTVEKPKLVFLQFLQNQNITRKVIQEELPKTITSTSTVEPSNTSANNTSANNTNNTNMYSSFDINVSDTPLLQMVNIVKPTMTIPGINPSLTAQPLTFHTKTLAMYSYPGHTKLQAPPSTSQFYGGSQNCNVLQKEATNQMTSHPNNIHTKPLHKAWKHIIPHRHLAAYVYPADQAIIATRLQVPGARMSRPQEILEPAGVQRQQKDLAHSSSFCGYVYGIDPIEQYGQNPPSRVKQPVDIPFSVARKVTVRPLRSVSGKSRKHQHTESDKHIDQFGQLGEHGNNSEKNNTNTTNAIYGTSASSSSQGNRTIPSKYPQLPAGDQGATVADFGDSAGEGLPWDVVNQLLWVLDDVVANADAGTTLEEVLLVNRYLRRALFQPKPSLEGKKHDTTVLLGSWMRAWKKLYDKDAEEVLFFLERASQREKLLKGRLF